MRRFAISDVVVEFLVIAVVAVLLAGLVLP